MAPTPHDREDQDRIADFLKGLQDAKRDATFRAVTHTAAILGAVAVGKAIKNSKRDR